MVKVSKSAPGEVVMPDTLYIDGDPECDTDIDPSCDRQSAVWRRLGKKLIVKPQAEWNKM